MHWNNFRLLDPVAHDQKWKTTVRPNFATLLIAILITIPIAFFKPVLLLAIVPAFGLIGLIWYRLANRALKKMNEDKESGDDE